jgi:hypothetical protein
MKLSLLDTVVLKRDLPEHGLRLGDAGAVVELYGTDGVEVEFLRASGQTKALVTLKAETLALAAHPALPRILEESRQRCKPGQGISTAEMRQRLKQRRLGDSSPGRRRVRRPARKAGRRTSR